MCLQEILELAERYDKKGNKKEAERLLKLAEKYEAIMRRNKQTILNCEKTKGLR